MSKLSKVLNLIGVFAPQVLAFTPLAPIAPAVALAMQEAQQLEGATGEQKLAHVTKIAVTAASAANEQAGKVIIDPRLVEAAASSAISAVKGVVNIVHAAHETTTPAGATTGPVEAPTL